MNIKTRKSNSRTATLSRKQNLMPTEAVPCPLAFPVGSDENRVGLKQKYCGSELGRLA
ncbi:MAG: hypothetical protein WC765_11105 [Phycisphaerae bacterium]